MSYRYNTLDIIVGVGMCAILFGAMLVFVAASGTFTITASQPALIEQFSGVSAEMAWLQPALGHAIVEQTLLQRHSDQLARTATSEWNQAMQMHDSLQGMSGGPLGFVMQRAALLPIEHEARVQSVMGRYVVNFTRRGVRSGALSADQYLSDYNNGMIGAAESTGQRLHSNFISTWQPALGRAIVDASREYTRRVGAAQEQLGSAILHMAQANTVLEDAWATNQYQLGSLVVAVDRTTGVMAGRTAPTMIAEATQKGVSVASTRFAAVPEIPMGYLIAAAFGLCSIFFGGLMLAAGNREAKALAEARRNSSRWVYRMAS